MRGKKIYIVLLLLAVIAGFVLWLGKADIQPQEKTVETVVELPNS